MATKRCAYRFSIDSETAKDFSNTGVAVKSCEVEASLMMRGDEQIGYSAWVDSVKVDGQDAEVPAGFVMGGSVSREAKSTSPREAANRVFDDLLRVIVGI